MKKVTIDEQKEIEIDIVKWVKKFCKEHNLKFALAYGTCIGAVRHHGIIPWDDDIDILLPYKDYMKFIELMKEEKNCEYALLSPYYIDDYYYLYSKLVSKKTKLTEKGMKEISENGVFIDVFPICNLPDDEIEREKYCNKLRKMERRYSKYAHLKKYYVREGDSNFKKIIKSIIYFPAKLTFNYKKSRKRLLDEMGKYSSSETNYMGYVASPTGYKSIMKKESYEPDVMMMFEGEEFPVVHDWDLYLTQLYGDYMELPPIEKRVFPHNLTIYWR